MTKIKDVLIDGKEYEIYYQKGIVLSANKYSTTSVSGGGNANGSNVNSRTTIHDDIFIKDSEGKEHSFQLSDFDLALREGHEVAVIWAVKKGAESGSYILVMNNSTDQNFMSDRGITELYFTLGSNLAPYAKVLSIGCLGIVALAVIIYVTRGSWTASILGFGILIFLLVRVLTQFSKKHKNKRQEFKNVLNNIAFSDLR